MKRSKLRNKSDKERNAKTWCDYKQKQNYCSNLLKRNKTHHFNNLEVKGITKSERSGKTMKPFFYR